MHSSILFKNLKRNLKEIIDKNSDYKVSVKSRYVEDKIKVMIKLFKNNIIVYEKNYISKNTFGLHLVNYAILYLLLHIFHLQYYYYLNYLKEIPLINSRTINYNTYKCTYIKCRTFIKDFL